ncbi:MAG: cysteine desulfurase [Acidimicrobiales bacterium]|nr:MAG: cysteine desulfurase [Acidimicrobiales bacterium]
MARAGRMSGVTSPGPDTLDVLTTRAHFPILCREPQDTRLVFLDSAASSQKPRCVLDAMQRFYETSYANVHRGVYRIAEEATRSMEDARAAVARFIGASDPSSVVFTKNATESLNLVAQTWGRRNLEASDAVVLTLMEHHSNIVPWHQLREEKGFELRWIPLDDEGRLDLADLDALLDGAKLVGITAMSNVLGTITPVTEIARRAHDAGAIVVVDACQYVPHLPTDVEAWGADFVAFSGHKMCGPSGIGVLWGRRELLEEIPPFLGGGEMISDVSLDGFTPNEVPWKFEAGTPPIAEAVGLGAAVQFLESLGMSRVREHEKLLTAYAMDLLNARFGDDLVIHGPRDPEQRGGVVSFTIRGVHPHDVAQILDQEGVCVRAGHHCAKPLMRILGVPATTRASFYVYNTEEDVDALARAIARAIDFFAT